MLLPKASESLDLLTEAASLERFACLRRDLAALYAGYYIAELLTDLTDYHDPHPKLFDAARITLRHLGDPELRARRVLRFELACLRELGLMPALDQCAHCGAPVDTRGDVAFGLATGGVLCPSCRPGQPHVTTLSSTTLEAIRVLASPGRAWRELSFEPRGSEPGARPPDRRGGHQSCPGPSPQGLALPGSVNRWTWFPGTSVANRDPIPCKTNGLITQFPSGIDCPRCEARAGRRRSVCSPRCWLAAWPAARASACPFAQWTAGYDSGLAKKISKEEKRPPTSEKVEEPRTLLRAG